MRKEERDKAEEEAKKESKPEKLTDEEADAVLKKAYYEEDFKFGRDKLYSSIKANGHNLTRKQVNDWLKKQTLYQLDIPVFEAKDFVTQTAKDVNNVWNIVPRLLCFGEGTSRQKEGCEHDVHKKHD